jgi:WD40 repeat protein
LAVPNYLLAGFASNLGGRDRWGKLCLWDVNAEKEVLTFLSSGPYADVTWSPNGRIIGAAFTGRPPSNHKNPGTQSYIRIFNRFDRKKINEADCRAIDINDVTFCPYNDNIIAAGATDGKVYVWDRRNFTSNCLHVLEHDEPLAELSPGARREVEDTGVRFCGWNESRTGLVTGSSDGVVKVWDVFRSTEDAYTRDLVSLRSAVMSGAYSPDFSRFVVGEAKGSITVLDLGKKGQTIRNTPEFKLLRAESNTDSTSLPVSEEKQGTSSWTCPIKLCHDIEALSVTKESEGDSGRWNDRIPESMMAALSIADFNGPRKPKPTAGMLECSHCGAPARPRLRDIEQEEFPLCERCGFSCFRCGQRSKIGLALETVSCGNCKLEWRIGALGYDLIKKDDKVDTDMQDADNVLIVNGLSVEERINRQLGVSSIQEVL